METSNKQEKLCSLTKAPAGWYVLYQGNYKTPGVFNLHEKGLFMLRPRVASDLGARILVNEQNRAAVQYMYLVNKVTVIEETCEKFNSKLERGLVYLSDELELDEQNLKETVLEKKVQDEIIRVYNEWTAAFTDAKSGKINTEEIKTTFSTAFEKGQKSYREWLVRNNSPWILPLIPRMTHDFRYGIYKRAGNELYEYYKDTGGNSTVDDLLKKINLFARIYEGEGLFKPEGSSWASEDEMWDCWIAFSGSEEEAKRICKTMEKTIIPLEKELREELSINA